MNSDDVFSAALKAVGLKITEPRLQVLRVFSRNRLPQRIKDVYTRLKKSSAGIDMVTIYRTVQILTEKNIVRRVDFGEGAAFYEWNDGKDAHHMSCISCNHRVVVPNCFFPELESRIKAKTPSFQSITRHSIEYYGVCKKCAIKKKNKH